MTVPPKTAGDEAKIRAVLLKINHHGPKCNVLQGFLSPSDSTTRDAMPFGWLGCNPELQNFIEAAARINRRPNPPKRSLI